MKLAGLSPEAHGTLRALRNLNQLRRFDVKIAQELVQKGYAKFVSREEGLTLVVADVGNGAFSPGSGNN